MKAISIALLVATLATPAVADTGDSVFLCIADMATGFKFDQTTKQWQSAQFDTSKNKFTVKATKDGITWNDFGSPFPPLQCSAFNEAGFTSCELGGMTIVNFNRVNMRFQYVYLSGWVDSDLPPPKSLEGNSALIGFWKAATAKAGNTPMLEIGRCSAL